MDIRDKGHVPDDRNIGKSSETVTPGKLASEGVGGAAAGAAGAAIGSLAGPIGTFIGGLAGVIGGWWAGKSAAEAAGNYSDEDDRFYRKSYESSSTRIADRSYEDIRPAYQAGHVAGLNPDYRNRNWDEVDRDLQRGWTNDLRGRHGEWDAARPFARDAFTRSRAAAATSTAAGAVREAGHKTANAIDDLKDRVDGNPASRPGPDATDRPERSS